jgi:hypothetical protein
MTQQQKDIYERWKNLVNMTAGELEIFANSYWGKQAGLSRSEASRLGIRSGRDSARAIIRMKRKGVKNWNENDWQWAIRQISFNSRTLGTLHSVAKRKGFEQALFNKKGEPTRLFLALLIWGHNPLK